MLSSKKTTNVERWEQKRRKAFKKCPGHESNLSCNFPNLKQGCYNHCASKCKHRKNITALPRSLKY